MGFSIVETDTEKLLDNEYKSSLSGIWLYLKLSIIITEETLEKKA